MLSQIVTKVFSLKSHFQSKSKKVNYKLILLISLILFSTVYWIAALNKDFHVDEFYSWVYSERCSFQEIITLKDTGIGHLPLFHFIQKTIQTVFPSYQPFQVRFANYFIGLFFLAVMIPFLLKINYNPLFCFSISISGGVLNAFVFSRMWGLLCLFSAIMLWRGEEYLENRTKNNLFLFILSILLGFLSDLNFILLVPYIFYVFFANKSSIKRIMEISILFIAIFWVYSITLYGFRTQHPLTFFFYSLGSNLTQISYEIYLMLFNFWYQEFNIASILVIFISIFLASKKSDTWLLYRKDEISFYIKVFIAFLLFVLLQVFIKEDLIRVRLILLAIFIVIIYLVWYYKKIEKQKIVTRNMILFFSIIASALLVLAASPHFWRDLIKSRFVIVLMPFLLIFLIRILPKQVLKTVSVVLIIAGFLYLFSEGIDECYPPEVVNKETSVVFQNELAYSTQYLRTKDKNPQNPYFLDNSSFLKFCRVCTMGTTNIPFQNFIEFNLLARNDFEVYSYVPSYFVLSDKKVINLNFLDKFFFRFLSPVYPYYYELYSFKKVGDLPSQ